MCVNTFDSKEGFVGAVCPGCVPDLCVVCRQQPKKNGSHCKNCHEKRCDKFVLRADFDRSMSVQEEKFNALSAQN